jgi:hypothetical protein
VSSRFLKLRAVATTDCDCCRFYAPFITVECVGSLKVSADDMAFGFEKHLDQLALRIMTKMILLSPQHLTIVQQIYSTLVGSVSVGSSITQSIFPRRIPVETVKEVRSY